MVMCTFSQVELFYGKVKKHERVTLSSTRVEYMAITLALKEGIWLKYFLKETMLFPNHSLIL
jgi:hypothetical protein